MKNHAFIFSALVICSALFPLPEFLVEKQTTSAPKPRHLEEIAFDKSNNALYMFGGSELQDQTWKEPVELYLFKDGWKRIESKGPLGRRGHALIYDDVEKRIVLIGGVCQTKSGSDSVLFDLWKLVNGEWSILETKCPVKEPRAVYDRVQRRILVYGDANNLTKAWSGGDERKFELWEFRADKWTRLSDGGPADGPFPLTYNEKNQSLTFLQWKDLNRLVIWEWRSSKWSTQEFTSNIPVSRNKYAFCFHPLMMH